MELMILISCLLCLLATVAVLRFLAGKPNQRSPAKLPPGPYRLPIIGNLHNLGGEPHKSLAHLAKVHGPLMSLKLGRVTTIVASSAAVAREILRTHDQVLSNRHLYLAFCVHRHHDFGMTLLPVGTKWRNLRKVCNTHLFATNKLDSNRELRSMKMKELLDEVQQNADERKAVDIRRVAFRTSFSALSMTIFSLNMTKHGSTEVEEFKEAEKGLRNELRKPNLGDFFPLLGGMDLQGIKRRMEGHMGKLLNLFGAIIDRRLEERKSEGYVSANDMLDMLLDIGDGNGDGEAASMDVDLIKHLLLDLFVAGTDATSGIIEWAMVEMLRNPNTFDTARKELDQIVGKGNLFQESDIARLPYLQAILKETMRLHPTGPFLIPRNAGADVKMFGFTVPKGAQILVNAWAIGRDPTTWENPDSFAPERFMGSEIDVRGNSFELIPFGGGRRICPGLPLAMRMLHMMLGTLVHRFGWKLEDGVDPKSLDAGEKFGITLQKDNPLLVVPTLI